MASRKITLFELHFDGGVQFGPKSIGGRGETGEPVGEERVEDADLAVEDEATGRRIRLGPSLAALAVVVGLGLGARRLMSRGDADVAFDEEETIDEGDDIDIEA